MIISCTYKKSSLNFVSIYRPPDSSLPLFHDDFMDLVSFVSAFPSCTIISGDFNLHMDSSTCPKASAFKSLLDSCALTQHVDFPTHLHGHTLDLAITPSDFTGLNSVQKGCFLSDHCCILAHLDFNTAPPASSRTITYRKYNKIDSDALQSDLLESDLIQHPSDNIDQLYDQYHDTLSSLLDKHAPIKSKTFSKSKPKWIDDSFLNAKRQKRQYERSWRRNKTPLNRSKLRKQINYCNRHLEKSKSNFYSGLIKQNEGNPKKLWNELNKILHRTPVSALPDHVSEKSLANTFSDFFITKISKIRDLFTGVSPSAVSPDKPPKSLEDFNLVSEPDVWKFILESPTKSCQLDPWPTFLVKDYVDILLSPITKLVNISLRDGIFPHRFKEAVVTPLIKKSSLPKNELKNYRPVSGLCFISKLVERVVAAQVKSHLELNDLNNNLQSAYSSGHSTETALLSIKNDIHLSLSKGLPTALILLDLSAAFDTIDHDLLLERLSTWFGFTRTVSKWFLSYISCRKQSVKIGNTLSEPVSLDFGVPQGSVLGPILFTLYTTPLSKVISSHKYIRHHLYADDTQIYIELTPINAEVAIPHLQECLREVQAWMASNKLKLNPDKTEFIVFGSPDQRSKLAGLFPIDILGNSISPSDNVRNLGVLFDSDFSFSKQVSNITKSCFVQLRDLRRIRNQMSLSVATTLANALVSSRLDYCNSLLNSLKQREFNRLKAIQNSLCRIVTKTSKFSHITPALKSLHWLPILERVEFKTCVLVHKSLHTSKPSYFSPYIERYSCVFRTRRSKPENNYLSKPVYDSNIHCSKVHFDNSFAYYAPNLWNSLPPEIRSITKLYTFRKALKTYLFSKAYPP